MRRILKCSFLLLALQFSVTGLQARSIPGVYVGKIFMRNFDGEFSLPGGEFRMKLSLRKNIPVRCLMNRNTSGEFMPAARPPVTGRDVLNQMGGAMGGIWLGALAGVITGGVIGGIAVGAVHPDNRWSWEVFQNESLGMQYGALLGAWFGIASGICFAGNDDYMHGSYIATITGTVLAGGVGTVMAIASFGVLTPAAILFPFAGGLLAYNFTRKAKNPADVSPANPQSSAAEPMRPGIRFSVNDNPAPGPASLQGAFLVRIVNLRF